MYLIIYITCVVIISMSHARDAFDDTASLEIANEDFIQQVRRRNKNFRVADRRLTTYSIFNSDYHGDHGKDRFINKENPKRDIELAKKIKRIVRQQKNEPHPDAEPVKIIKAGNKKNEHIDLKYFYKDPVLNPRRIIEQNLKALQRAVANEEIIENALNSDSEKNHSDSEKSDDINLETFLRSKKKSSSGGKKKKKNKKKKKKGSKRSKWKISVSPNLFYKVKVYNHKGEIIRSAKRAGELNIIKSEIEYPKNVSQFITSLIENVVSQMTNSKINKETLSNLINDTPKLNQFLNEWKVGTIKIIADNTVESTRSKSSPKIWPHVELIKHKIKEHPELLPNILKWLNDMRKKFIFHTKEYLEENPTELKELQTSKGFIKHAL